MFDQPDFVTRDAQTDLDLGADRDDGCVVGEASDQVTLGHLAIVTAMINTETFADDHDWSGVRPFCHAGNMLMSKHGGKGIGWGSVFAPPG